MRRNLQAISTIRDRIMSTGIQTLEQLAECRPILTTYRHRLQGAEDWEKLVPLIEAVETQRRLSGRPSPAFYPEDWLGYSYLELPVPQQQLARRIQRRVMQETGIVTLEKWEWLITELEAQAQQAESDATPASR